MLFYSPNNCFFSIGFVELLIRAVTFRKQILPGSCFQDSKANHSFITLENKEENHNNVLYTLSIPYIFFRFPNGLTHLTHSVFELRSLMWYSLLYMYSAFHVSSRSSFNIYKHLCCSQRCLVVVSRNPNIRMSFTYLYYCQVCYNSLKNNNNNNLYCNLLFFVACTKY